MIIGRFQSIELSGWARPNLKHFCNIRVEPRAFSVFALYCNGVAVCRVSKHLQPDLE
jgi:hypothetical protein